jgi:hypothetical protein
MVQGFPPHSVPLQRKIEVQRRLISGRQRGITGIYFLGRKPVLSSAREHEDVH